LVQSLKLQGVLKSSAVEQAFLNVPREEFIWQRDSTDIAYVDEPLALGETGQTISAPSMVAIMLEELELGPGMRVLEVGTGSGYNAALLGSIVGRKVSNEPNVISIERDPKLGTFAENNLRRVNMADYVKVVVGDGTLGYPARSEEELYDRIIVTAGAPEIPHYLNLQLKIGGIMEIPVGNIGVQTLVKLRKVPDPANHRRHRMKREDIVGCMFVPLIGEAGYKF
jgi:protein-L-isoaspartate(D-aspartate) O-methyltransferase